MSAVPTPPGSPTSATDSPATSGAFFPLTLSAIRCTPTERGETELGSLAARAAAAERAASDSWQALLGDCACARRWHFPDHLRRLSEAAGEYADGEWWRGRGSAHRDRMAEFEHWATEALAEGDGEEFAEACAGYDAALAHALVTMTAATPAPPGN
jgi:hypothetical protein